MAAKENVKTAKSIELVMNVAMAAVYGVLQLDIVCIYSELNEYQTECPSRKDKTRNIECNCSK